MKIYPFDLPGNIHPLAWVFLGFGLDTKRVNELAKHVFDDLGARLNLEIDTSVEVCVAVDWPFEKEGYTAASVGDEVDWVACSEGAIRVREGHLPPGLKLDKHTGHITGRIREPGLYRAVFEVGPRVKYDPLGGNGSPESKGMWIPIDQDLFEPELTLDEYPATVADLDDVEKSKLLAELQAWQNTQVAKGVTADGDSSA